MEHAPAQQRSPGKRTTLVLYEKKFFDGKQVFAYLYGMFIPKEKNE